MVEKVVNAKAKAGLQPFFETSEINSSCPKRYRLLVKKDKDDAYWKQHNEAINRNKKRLSLTTLLLPQINLRPRLPTPRSAKKGRGDYLAIRVNAIEVAKKDKDKTKDLSYFKCYTCKQKGHYVNKYPEKPKN